MKRCVWYFQIKLGGRGGGEEYIHNKIQTLLQKIQHQKVAVPGTTE